MLKKDLNHLFVNTAEFKIRYQPTIAKQLKVTKRSPSKSPQELTKGKSWWYARRSILLICSIPIVYTYAKRSDPLIFDTLR